MDCIRFKINGYSYSVGCEVSSTTMLVDYVRENLGLRGTKYMCREGGCGTCIVSVKKSEQGPVLAINACMVPITSCHGWDIITIEYLGNRNKGYHILQKTLAENYGSQCGYCSPAWVMNMYSFLQRNKKPTKLEIERAFGSNICRCTGYRPILKVLKMFSAEENLNLPDIEELTICKKKGAVCTASCHDDVDNEWCILKAEDINDSYFKIKLKDGRFWYNVTELFDIFRIIAAVDNQSYMLIHGNTGKGVRPILEYPKTLIDISSIKELKSHKLDQNLVIGAGVTLTELENLLNKTAETVDNFGYLKKIVEHLQVVAHIPIRNQASIGGNLMLKHQFNDFQSDLFVLFETVSAYVNILFPNKTYSRYSMQEFLTIDMKGKVLVHVLLPPLSDKHRLITFKVAPRFQNAHAIVNAGFLFKLIDNNIVEEARMVYGGLSPKFNRAFSTEKFLINRSLFENETLQSAITVLENELVLEEMPPEPSVECRRKLALALFYKGLLSLIPSNSLSSFYKSGSQKLHFTRPVSTGRQTYDTNAILWPLNQPIPKVEALIQCAGEAKYVDDLPLLHDDAHIAFVLSEVGVGTILKIDPSAALAQPGVIAFYSASDIPGINSFTPIDNIIYLANEEILCSGNVMYYNQPIGIVVAETHQKALVAARMVQVAYTNTNTKVVINLKEASKDPSRNVLSGYVDAVEKGTDIVKTFNGENLIFTQCHFPMENIACVTRPTEEGVEVYATTHWIDSIQLMLSRALNIQENHIEIYVRRLGGSFGLKLSRATRMAILCALATLRLNRNCRFVVPLTDTMRAIGKRLPCYTTYECSVNADGVIQYVKYTSYEDNGYKINEFLSILATDVFNNCYNRDRWDYKIYDTITDTAKNTWCRAPGSLEGIAMAELLMDRISYELSLDPIDVRLMNLNTIKYNDINIMVKELRQSASYDERKANVKKFNSLNRWNKRGLRVGFIRWTPIGFPRFDINLSICHGDGSVIIIHGGIEMGQGMNTKAVQICAYYFKIPVEKIQIKQNANFVTPNSFISGASLATQFVGFGVRKACLSMLERLKPIRNRLDNPTWEQLITEAYLNDVNLHVVEFVGSTDYVKLAYDIFGVAFAEVEVDILTGETEVLRVDILQDAGQSVNPELDIGQVEGAFIMGQGYWTTEHLVYDKTTGEVLTDRTWFYFVPLASDIPQDFRITLRKKSYTFDEILGSKGTGEPPICLSVCVALAIREAIVAARKDAGIPTTEWFQLDGPMTVEQIKLAAQCKTNDFKFN